MILYIYVKKKVVIIMKLFVGCSSSNDIPLKYIDDCKNYLTKLLKDNDLVFGAYNSGIMKISYDIAKKMNRKVIGISPVYFKEDLLQLDCDVEILTDSISQRTDKVMEESDAIIFLPGGIGTTYELLSAIESKRSNEFDKPIIIYNSNNFFDKLIEYLEKTYEEKFSSLKIKDCYYIAKSADDTINYLSNYYKGDNYE